MIFKNLVYNKKNKGITLIALVITIIVLLILAGVTITGLNGKNGLLTKARDASKDMEIASVKEQAQLDITNWITEKLEIGEEINLENWQEIKKILDEANPNTENRYYKKVTSEGIETSNGYIVPIEELYVNNFSSENITEVNTDNYGDRVNYISKGDQSLIWRIFYVDNEYIYLISSRPDSNGDGKEENTIDSCKLSDYPNNSKIYSGSEDIKDIFLQSLNSQWFNIVKGSPSRNDNAKVIAYLMDNDVWDKYKDNEGKASYAIGGPTIELFKNSYNESKETTKKIEITNCTEIGYDVQGILEILSDYNNGIYNNGKIWSLASPAVIYEDMIISAFGNLSYLNFDTIDSSRGLRPMVIIPKSKFQYKIIS